jgi:hypothetical protein
MLTAVVCSAPRRSAADSRCWDAAMGTSLPAAHKYFEDKGSIELNDIYFCGGCNNAPWRTCTAYKADWPPRGC